MLGATRYRTAAEISRQAQLSNDISKLQEQISSGKRINTPSDDPIASGRVSEIRQAQADQTVYSRNIDTASALSDQADKQFTNVETLLNQAKGLVLQGRNQATSDSDRATLATTLRGIIGDLNAAATSTDATGRSIFPATAPLSIPVSETLSIAPVQMRDTVFGNITTANGVKSIADILGIAADQLEGKNLDAYNAAAAAGTGTTGTSTTGATGTGATGTGTTGTGTTGTGTGTTGTGTGTGTTGTGSGTGTTDPTAAAPLTGTALAAARDTALAASLDALDAAADHVTDMHADQGIRGQRLDDAKTNLTNSSETLTEERSSLEDTDLTSAISEFQAKQTSLQAAQAVFAQVNKRTLFDLLG